MGRDSKGGGNGNQRPIIIMSKKLPFSPGWFTALGGLTGSAVPLFGAFSAEFLAAGTFAGTALGAAIDWILLQEPLSGFAILTSIFNKLNEDYEHSILHSASAITVQ